MEVFTFAKLVEQHNHTLISPPCHDNNHKCKIKCNLCLLISDKSIYNIKNKGIKCKSCFEIELTNEMHVRAACRGGKCLSTECKRVKDILKWQCGDCFYVWKTSLGRIREGTWCKRCASKKVGKLKTTITLKVAQDLATQHNGKCLSTVCKNGYDELIWECIFGHTWPAPTNRIKMGKWCPICIGKHKTIKDVQNVVEAMGGKLLTDHYTNGEMILNIICGSCSEEFNIRAKQLFIGHWCRKCATNRMRTPIKIVQQLAIDRGGKLLSIEYFNDSQILLWECYFGHQFEQTYGRASRRGSWCSQCNISLSELICRTVFELLFDNKFPKAKYSWLKNSKTGYWLELDGYCEQLNIAFEHNGTYHYKVVDKRFENLENIQARDLIKVETCKKRGIKLIIVPEIFVQLKKDDVVDFVISECEKLDIEIPAARKNIQIDVNRIIKKFYHDKAQQTLLEAP